MIHRQTSVFLICILGVTLTSLSRLPYLMARDLQDYNHVCEELNQFYFEVPPPLESDPRSRLQFALVHTDQLVSCLRKGLMEQNSSLSLGVDSPLAKHMQGVEEALETIRASGILTDETTAPDSLQTRVSENLDNLFGQMTTLIDSVKSALQATDKSFYALSNQLSYWNSFVPSWARPYGLKGKLVRPYRSEFDPQSWVQIVGMKLLSDGRTLVTVDESGVVYTSDSIEGKTIRENRQSLDVTQLNADEIVKVAFSPDEKTLTTLSYEGRVMLWNFVTGQLIRELGPAESKEHVQKPGSEWTDSTDTVFSEDGKTAIQANIHGSLFRLDTATGEKIKTWDSTDKYHTSWKTPSISVSADGSRLAACDSRKIIIWDTVSGKKTREFSTGKSNKSRIKPKAIVLSSDGKSLVAYNEKGLFGPEPIIIQWNTDTGEALKELFIDADELKQFANNLEKSLSYKRGGHWAEAISLSPDGRLVVVKSGHYSFHAWDLVTGESITDQSSENLQTRKNLAIVATSQAPSRTVRSPKGGYELRPEDRLIALSADVKTLITVAPRGVLLQWQ